MTALCVFLNLVVKTMADQVLYLTSSKFWICTTFIEKETTSKCIFRGCSAWLSLDINSDDINILQQCSDTHTQKQDLTSAAADTLSCHITSPGVEAGAGAGGSKAKQEVDVD